MPYWPLGRQSTFEACVKVTRPGGVISNIGYHGDGGSLNIPLAEFGMGMSDKTIRTALCPGGRERMTRLLRLMETRKIDPTPMTTHRFRACTEFCVNGLKAGNCRTVRRHNEYEEACSP